MKGMALVVFAVFAVSVIDAGAAGSNDIFRAGAAKGNITPPLGAPIIGGFHPFPATHVHDDLFAKCLVLDNGKTRAAFVVCDLLGLSRGVSDEARRLVQEETGLSAGNVLVSATHTHSAISALGGRYNLTPELDDYQKFVARRIADTVRCAINNLEPARIGWTTASVPQHVFCRRWFLKPGTMPVNPFGSTNDLVKMNPARASANLDRPAGPTDPQICLVAVKALDGRPLALLSNYSLHYVGGVRGADISADYYGMYSDRIQQLLGADRQDPPFVALMSNGTSGNINNIDFTKPGEKLPPYARMRTVADDVAQAVHAAYQRILWRDTVPLAVAFEEIDLAFRHPTPEQCERAKGVLAKLAPGVKPNTLEEIYAARTLEVTTAPERWHFALQAFRVGEVGIATLPNEVFSEIGLEIKARSPFKPTFVVSLAHGYFGYLPTPEQHKLGGYETWLGTSRLEIEAAPKMGDALVRMLKQLDAPAP
ncbi:MAG TPA: hypothetical protein PKM57_07585 [Kiritimatiellia bacterium]|nr:hypothetical protein [Kiritimatiellia bacterium]HPS06871.1 hypothetical protein [Kiritimatiellia bacterium]